MRFGAAILAVTLASCGGGGGGGDPPATPASGQVDTTYASGGRFALTLPGYGGPASARRVAVASDGRVYLAGPTIRRLDSAGNLDPAYGVNLPSTAPLLDEAGNLYVLAADGIAKLDPDGRPATSFGTNGKAPAPWLRGDSGTFARDRFGNLALVGPAAGSNGSSPEAIAAKFDRDGRLMPSFGNGGTLVLAVPGDPISYIDAVALDFPGNVYIGGLRSGITGPTSAFVMKLGADGRPATEFGAGGFWFAPPICSRLAPQAIAFDAAGYLYLACEQAIFKLDTLGILDPSFGLLGASTPLGNAGPGGAGNVTSLVVASNGEVFAAGLRAAAVSPCTDFVVARLDSRGALVVGFGVEGRAAVDVDARDDSANVAMDGAGRLYVSGVSIPACTIMGPISQSTFSVTRLK